MRTKLVATFAIAVLAVLGTGYWYVAMRDTSKPVASLSKLKGTDNGDEPAAPANDLSGTWNVTTGSDVFVGYRVKETVVPANTERTANGRSSAVSGSITIADGRITAATVTVDVTKLASDDPLREQVLAKIGLETEKFPTATLTLTEPVALPENAGSGADVTLTLNTQLDAHGTKHPLTVELQAAFSNGAIVAATTGDGAKFTMSDWGITLPDVPTSKNDGTGTIEAQLRFVKQ